MESREKASNLTETQDQEAIDVVENQKKGQNKFFGDFLTEEEVKRVREEFLQSIEKYQVLPKEGEKEREDQDQKEIDRLKKEIGLME